MGSDSSLRVLDLSSETEIARVESCTAYWTAPAGDRIACRTDHGFCVVDLAFGASKPMHIAPHVSSAVVLGPAQTAFYWTESMELIETNYVTGRRVRVLDATARDHTAFDETAIMAFADIEPVEIDVDAACNDYRPRDPAIAGEWSNGVAVAVYAPDGRHLICGDPAGRIFMWDKITETTVCELQVCDVTDTFGAWASVRVCKSGKWVFVVYWTNLEQPVSAILRITPRFTVPVHVGQFSSEAAPDRIAALYDDGTVVDAVSRAVVYATTADTVISFWCSDSASGEHRLSMTEHAPVRTRRQAQSAAPSTRGRLSASACFADKDTGRVWYDALCSIRSRRIAHKANKVRK
jgi:hypothetical protein